MSYDDLIEAAKGRLITISDIEVFCAQSMLPIGDSLDACALQLARAYAARTVDFDVADVVANALFAYAAHQYGAIPDLMFSIFLAFDSGEFYPDEVRDPSAEDRFTRPQIQQILETYFDRSETAVRCPSALMSGIGR